MSLILQKNVVQPNFKSMDSAPNFYTSQSARVSPQCRNSLHQPKISKFQKLCIIQDGHKTDRPNYESTFVMPCFSNFVRKQAIPIFQRAETQQQKIAYKQKTPPIQIKSLSNYFDEVKIKSYLSYLMQNQRQQNKMSLGSKQCVNLMKNQHNSPLKTKIDESSQFKDIEPVQTTDVSIMQFHTKDRRHHSRDKQHQKVSIVGTQINCHLGTMMDMKKKDMLFATLQKVIIDQQQYYDLKYQDKIISLRRSVQELMKYITQLSSYLNNKKKLFYVIKKLIYLKIQLKQVLMNEKFDALIEPLSEANMMKNLQHKENMSVKSQSIPVIKYDFSIQKDLNTLTDQIQEYILQQRVDGYDLMEWKIRNESREIQVIEEQMLGQQHQKVLICLTMKKLINLNKYTPVKIKDFSFKTQSMTQYNPHVTLDIIEQRLGYSNKVSTSNRTVGKSIEKLILSLEKNYLY